MGQKINPIGLRLGIHRKWNSSWYVDFINYSKFLHINFKIEEYLKGFLYYYSIKTLLVNSKIIKLPSNQLYIFVFFYRLRKKKKKIKKIRFKKPLKYFLIKKSLNKYYNKSINNMYLKNNLNLNYLNYNKFIKKVDKNSLSLTNINNDINSLKNTLINTYIYIKYINKYSNKTNGLTSSLKKHYDKNFRFIRLNILKYSLILNIKILYSKNLNKNSKILSFKLNTTLKKLQKLLRLINLIKIKNNNIKLINFINLNQSKFINKKYLSFLLFFVNYNLKKVSDINLNIKNHINAKKFGLNKIKQIHSQSNKISKNNSLIKKTKNIKIVEIKRFLSKLTNSKISIIFINSLSFIKFYYQLEQKNKFLKKDPNIFVNIQKQMLNSYRYHAIYIQDFVNIAFIALVFKNIKLLTDFIGFQFKKLPKNKRQLKLIQLITKTLQIIFKERKEISGLKIQFKGRINKRKRARTINFKDGIISLQSHSSRVEYSYTNAYTRSGSLGIKLWLFYNKNFKNELRRNFLYYIKYSNYQLNKKRNVVKTKPSKI